jgi:hypothetical protein
MSLHFYRNIDNKHFYPDSTVPTYFDIMEGYLDIHTMRYRIFGAVWKSVDGGRYMLGYWFADQADGIYRCIQKEGFSNIMKAKENEINEIYCSIRMDQDKENWSKRKRLYVLPNVKTPWSNISKGWYVLKSNSNFPIVLTCIQKRWFSIWIEHRKVCESEEDIKKFINSVNLEHNLNFTSDIIRQI